MRTLIQVSQVIKANNNLVSFDVLGQELQLEQQQLIDLMEELEKINLVILSLIDNMQYASLPTEDVEQTVDKVAQATRQTRTKKATVDGAGKQKTTAPDTSKENKSTKDNDMTSATSTIETLIQSIEAQAFSTKPTYRTMQSLLKTARETHNIELQVVLNKAAKVLQEECRRIVNEFKAGTVKTRDTSNKRERSQSTQQSREPKVEVKKESKAKQPTTHTSDKVEAPAPVSEPKQTSTDLLLKEAQAEIEALRKQLADKTNEVAEYAEALEHAQATVKKQQQALDLQKQVITKLTANQAPATEPVHVAEVEQAAVVEPAVEVVAEVETEDEWEDDNSDAVDAMMVMLMDGKREVIAEAMNIVERKLGKDRMLSFQLALSDVELLSYGEYATAFRNLMTTYNVKMDWIEQAVDKVSA